MNAISKCLVVVALLCGSAASIADQVVDYIYVGAVDSASSSEDGVGLFGPAGASLAGDSFTARFRFKVVDSLGTASDTVTSNCTITVAPAPPVVAQLADLLTDVQGIGSGESLAHEVKLAQTYYAARDVPATCAVLTALVEDVKTHVEKKRSKTHRGDIVRDARAIQHAIGCFDEDRRSCRDFHHRVERERDDHDCHRREHTERGDGHEE